MFSLYAEDERGDQTGCEKIARNVAQPFFVSKLMYKEGTQVEGFLKDGNKDAIWRTSIYPCIFTIFVSYLMSCVLHVSVL
jgi:hypothetical protein